NPETRPFLVLLIQLIRKSISQFPFRGLRTDELALLVLGRGQKETGELLHRGFRMQFVEIKKRTKETALAKRTAFRVQRTED
ncbi:hypothetical protein GS521_02350, partial [Leptospira borgpetersenii]